MKSKFYVSLCNVSAKDGYGEYTFVSARQSIIDLQCQKGERKNWGNLNSDILKALEVFDRCYAENPNISGAGCYGKSFQVMLTPR